MAFGDRLTRPGQIEWGGVLLDLTDDTTDAEGLIPPNGVKGLRLPPRKRLSTPLPLGHGSFAGRDVWLPRKPSITGLQVHGDADVAQFLASTWPTGPANERELGWWGFGWPEDRPFRALARVDEAAETFDQGSATEDYDKPDIAWECFDPFAYEFDQRTTGLLSPGSVTPVVSYGTCETTRVRVTWTGPWHAPGIATSAVAGGVIFFPTLDLPAGQTLVAHFHRYTERFFTSSHFTRPQAYKAAMGGGPPLVYAPPRWFPLVPGTQTITAYGTGTGHMEMVWFDAHATPPLPAEGS